MWFSVTAKLEKVLESGLQKKVNEKYLVDAMSCTEAEVRIIDYLKPFACGEMDVTSTKVEQYSELFLSEEGGDYYYDVKVDYLTMDEKTAREKKTRTKMLVQANNLEEAIKRHKKGMEGTLADYSLSGITETKILDVLVFKAD